MKDNDFLRWAAAAALLLAGLQLMSMGIAPAPASRATVAAGAVAGR